MKNLFLYEVKEYWPKWAKVTLTVACWVVCIGLVLAAMIFTGWKIYDGNMQAYVQFSKTYEGIGWTYWDLEPTEKVTITVDGKKNGYGAFEGDIQICGETFAFSYPDCRVLILDGKYAVLCSNKIDGKDLRDYPIYGYAAMLVDREWNNIVLYKPSSIMWGDQEMQVNSNDWMITAPAMDLEEAVALAKAMSQGEKFFSNLTFDKRDHQK